MAESKYNRKRDFKETSEPAAVTTSVDVDPMLAPVGDLFVIHQHYATRLHHDLRLEMFNGQTPVLVSWAIPKLLPKRKGHRHLAVRTEDHPIEYATFSGSIPEGNYGAGEVRIDTGRFEAIERDGRKLSIRLTGGRIDGVFHLIHTRDRDSKEEWLALLGDDLRQGIETPRVPASLLARTGDEMKNDPEWSFEPKWGGVRAIAVCGVETVLISGGNDISSDFPELSSINNRLVAVDAMLDGEIVSLGNGSLATYVVFDLLYLDGHNVDDKPVSERRRLLEEIMVPRNGFRYRPRD